MRKSKVLLSTLFYLCCFIFLGINVIPEVFPQPFTTYSKSFNNENFEKILIGDDRKKVNILLGKPLYYSEDNVNRDSIKLNYWYTVNSYKLLGYDKVIIQFYENKVVNKIRVTSGD